MRILFVLAAMLSFGGCASAQTAIERRFIPEADLAFPAFAESENETPAIVDNSPWADFLKTYVSVGDNGVALVAYGAVTDADAAALDDYVSYLQQIDPAALSSDDQLAFWINLYNAVTIALILDEYPLHSIRSIKSGFFDFKGPWDDKRVSVGGEDLSLNDIEHGIIRAIYVEPRIHYAVNCASIGCPDLRGAPYEGETIEAALDEQARIYVKHPRGVTVDDRGRVTASRIYAWYREDFGDDESDVLDHIRQYAAPELLAALAGATSIARYEYDWSLNQAN
jgi:hypothetical protein